MTRLINRIQKELHDDLTGKSNLSLVEKEFLAEYEKTPLRTVRKRGVPYEESIQTCQFQLGAI